MKPNLARPNSLLALPVALLALLAAAPPAGAQAAPTTPPQEVSQEVSDAIREVNERTQSVRDLLAKKQWSQAWEASQELHDVLDVEPMHAALAAALAGGHWEDSELLAERLLSQSMASMGDALAWIYSVDREGDRNAVLWARKIVAGRELAGDFGPALEQIGSGQALSQETLLRVVASLADKPMPAAAGQGLLLQRAFLPTARARVGDRTWAIGYSREGLVARSGDDVDAVSLHGELSSLCAKDPGGCKPGTMSGDWGPQMRMVAKRSTLTRQKDGSIEYEYNLEMAGVVGEANPMTNDTTCTFHLSPATIIEACGSSYSGGAHPDVSSSVSHYSLRPDRRFQVLQNSCAGAKFSAAEFAHAHEGVLDQCGAVLDESRDDPSRKMSAAERRAAALELVGGPVCSYTDYHEGRWAVVGQTTVARILRGSDCDMAVYDARITNPAEYEKGLMSTDAPFSEPTHP